MPSRRRHHVTLFEEMIRVADDKKDTEKTSEPLSYGFVRNARWWYAAAWLFLLAILLIRWDKVGY